MLQGVGRGALPRSLARVAPLAAGLSSRSYAKKKSLQTIMEAEKPTFLAPLLTRKSGSDLLNDPMTNKGTAFSFSERERLGVRGLLPPCRLSIDEQARRVMRSYNDDNETSMQKYVYLNALQDRNETLFYRVLMQNIDAMAPIVYTPTVGDACLTFGSHYRRARGMYFCAHDRGHMHAMVYNWPYDDVDIIVVTDGSRILGLGDLGVHGMGIPIGKLTLYVAAGGVHPKRVLPVTIDVGTDNEDLLNSPYYLGIKERRLKGEEYMDVVDEFMEAVKHRWPHALVQFEDFSNANAGTLLRKYRNTHLCFNDDIQGTGTVTVAGLLSCLKGLGKPPASLCDQTIVCLGAGSAGLGVAESISYAMQEEGLSEEEAKSRFFMVDQDGLLGVTRRSITHLQRSYSRSDAQDGLSLLETIKIAQPTILLGLSGAGSAFTEEVIREMKKYCPTPIIFPLSNPTSKAECTLQQAVEWTDGKLLFASGSPFDPVEYNGQMYHSTQGNNMYIFPGVGLGAVICRASKITDRMFYRAAKALTQMVSPAQAMQGKLYPPIKQIRKVSELIAAEVCLEAMDSKLANREDLTVANLKEVIESEAYYPDYAPVVRGADPHTHAHHGA